MTRHRLLSAAVLLGVIVAGLGTRIYGRYLPELVAAYGGDTLWALMVFVGLGLVAPAWPTGRIAIVALTIAYGVEVSQLYHAPWIDHLRQIPLLRLVLGEGFLWSDFVCYTVGVAIGVVSERILNAVN